MVTELTKPVKRRRGGLIIIITDKGARLRGERRHDDSSSVFVTWEDIAKLGLQREGVSLRESQWAKPLQTLQKLARLKQYARSKGKSKE